MKIGNPFIKKQKREVLCVQQFPIKIRIPILEEIWIWKEGMGNVW